MAAVGTTAVLGIDVGTTATKALLLRPDGTHEFGAWPSAADPLDVWPRVKAWLPSGITVEAVGVTAHGPSAVTGARLEHRHITPNHKLRSLIASANPVAVEPGVPGGAGGEVTFTIAG